MVRSLTRAGSQALQISITWTPGVRIDSTERSIKHCGGARMEKSATTKDESPSRLIDARIRGLDDWRGEMLAHVRALIKKADPQVEEEWKWRGVPVWSHDGIICTGETYK